MTATRLRQRWAEAEHAYQAALAANPTNNRNVGSTYGGGPNGKRASRPTRRAPRSAKRRLAVPGAASSAGRPMTRRRP
jgi:hypothetical protein